MPDLEEEIKNEFSKELSDAIDAEIIAGMLVEMGWHLVELGSLVSNRRAIDIKEWCEENVKHKYQSIGHKFIFSDSGDAVNFTLKWR